MANSCTAIIPFSDIEKIEVYINKPRKSLSAIKKATGADYIFNGTLYNMLTGAAVCHLKADGKIIANPNYTVWGFAWNNPSDFSLDILPNSSTASSFSKANYIACTNLITNGSPLAKPCNDPARQGKRGCTAVGVRENELVLYCSKDKTTAAKTPVQLRDHMMDLGCVSAIMLDGGGSSQCDFVGETVTSTRKVPHLILVYLKNAKCPYDEPLKLVKSGSRGDDAKWVQWHLNKHGASLTVDGIFGTKSVAALKEFQRNWGLDVDGLCGSASRAALKKF